MAESTPNDMKIKHQKAPDFVSTTADGAIAAVGRNFDKVHLFFYREALDVLSESATLEDADEGKYTTHIEADDTEQYREHVARITMSYENAKSLLALLNNRLSDTDED